MLKPKIKEVTKDVFSEEIPQAFASVDDYLKSKSAKVRKKSCPVRSHYAGKAFYVDEYLVPISIIKRVKEISQNRKGDVDKADLNEMAQSLKMTGQDIGIVVADFDFKENSTSCTPVLCWGNHRFEAVKDLQSEDAPIANEGPECPPGYIWTSSYTHPRSKLTGLQSLENELHKPRKRVSNDTRAITLKKIIVDQGNKDGKVFKDQDDEWKEERCYELMKEFMPGIDSKTREAVYKKYREGTPTFSSQAHSKGSLIGFWNSNNPYGLGGFTKINCGTKQIDRISILEEDGQYCAKLSGVWFLDQEWTSGATIQQLKGARNVNKKVEWTILVVTIPVKGKTSEQLKEARAALIEEISKWSKTETSGKLVDEIFFANQTVEEMESSEKTGTLWALTHRF